MSKTDQTEPTDQHLTSNDAGAIDELEIRIEDDTMCLSCGYALRGLKHRDACPECGLSVKTTMDRLHGLSSRQFFTLGLRLIAFAILVWPFVTEYGIINNIAWIFFDDDHYGYYESTGWFSLLIPGITGIVCSIGLWFAAPLIACIAAPTSFPLIANVGGPRTAMMICLSLFALWLIAIGGDSLFYALGAYGYSGTMNPDNLPGFLAGHLASGVFNVAAGALMLVWLVRHRDKLR